MKQRLLLPLSIALCFACTPADDNSGGAGGSSGKGGAGGGSATGGKGGGGGSVGTGGNVGTGGASVGTGGSLGGTGGTGGSVGSGGAGGSSAGSGGSTGADGGSQPDGGAAEGGGPAPTGPGAALHDQVFKVPCPSQTGTGTSCSPPANVRAWSKQFAFGGDPNTMYKVRFKFCAVFEARTYSGCQGTPENPNICLNGTLVNSPSYQATYPTLAFKPDAQRTYYLNGIWKSDDISKLDYSATFDVKGGSMVTFESDGGSNGGIYTAYQKARRYECPMPPGIEMQPYLGQFLHVKVESVTPMN